MQRDRATFLQRAAAAGLSWPLPEDLDDTQLEKLLFPPVPAPAGTRPEPDFSKVHQELKSNRYHVEVGGHHYSTPYQLVGQHIEARYMATVVEILYRGKRVAGTGPARLSVGH